jgi:hypothetical protein
VNAWSSAALDTSREQLWIYGGGHGDYYGNESYVFDVASAAWSRADDPTDLTQYLPLNTLVPLDMWWDGRPSGRHTYGGLTYIPQIDKFHLYGGSRSSGSGGMGGDNWLRGPVNGVWIQQQTTFNRIPAWGTSPGQTLIATVVHDGRVFAASNQRLRSWHPLLNTWQAESMPYNLPQLYWTALILGDRLFLLGQGAANTVGKLYWFDLSLPASQRAIQSVPRLSPPWIETQHAPGFDSDPKTGLGVAWAGGNEVWLLDPSTLQWTVVAVPGAPMAPSQGMYGRFRYVASQDAFLAVTSVDADVAYLSLR